MLAHLRHSPQMLCSQASFHGASCFCHNKRMLEEKSLEEILSDAKELRRLGHELIRASEKLAEKCERMRRRVADQSAQPAVIPTRGRKERGSGGVR
jgi:hypothetical protein